LTVAQACQACQRPPVGSYDDRIVDGLEAVQFLVRVKELCLCLSS
jgi:hypothetical protein